MNENEKMRKCNKEMMEFWMRFFAFSDFSFN